MARNDITWDKFRDHVRSEWVIQRLEQPLVRRIFRGQSNPDWLVQSLAERQPRHQPLSRQDYVSLRSKYLEPFKQRALPYLGIEGRLMQIQAQLLGADAVDKEWWALGRHYGLITPLLDWTRSPYVAAFFAYTAAGFPPPKKVTVWALDIFKGDLWKENEFELVDHASAINARQRAQQGVFTLKTDADTYDLETYLKNRGLSKRLERFDLPWSHLGQALHDLTQMNITHGSLFPDLSGAASDANVSGLYDVIIRVPEIPPGTPRVFSR